MPRFNFFIPVHKCLKAALYDGALALQKAEVCSADDAASLADSIREVLLLQEEWTRKEEQFLLPEVSLYEPAVADALQQEHAANKAMADRLSDRLTVLEQTQSSEHRIVLLAALNHDYVIYLASQLRHLAKEERVTHAVLRRYYSDTFIRSLMEQMRKATAPWHMAFFHKWLLRGLNHRETAVLLKTVQALGSPIEFETLCQEAGQELVPTALEKINQLVREVPAA